MVGGVTGLDSGAGDELGFGVPCGGAVWRVVLATCESRGSSSDSSRSSSTLER